MKITGFSGNPTNGWIDPQSISLFVSYQLYYSDAMFHGDILKLTRINKNFRKVIYTGKTSQLVVMNLKSKKDIGMETHDDVDQILFFASGTGKAVVGGKTKPLKAGAVVFVPAGTQHNFVNTGKTDMKLYTVYAPAEHAGGTIHKTKEDTMKEKH